MTLDTLTYHADTQWPDDANATEQDISKFSHYEAQQKRSFSGCLIFKTKLNLAEVLCSTAHLVMCILLPKMILPCSAFFHDICPRNRSFIYTASWNRQHSYYVANEVRNIDNRYFLNGTLCLFVTAVEQQARDNWSEERDCLMKEVCVFLFS